MESLRERERAKRKEFEVGTFAKSAAAALAAARFQRHEIDVVEVLDAGLEASHADMSANASADGSFSLAKKLAYAAPQFATTSLTMLIGIHGTLFFNRIGAQVAFIAFFTALARSFDVVTDPMMGWISDSTPMDRLEWVAHGRRRPYMLLGVVWYGVTFSALFNPPESLTAMGALAVSLWFGGFYLIFYLFDTMVNVPHTALGPELTDDQTVRNSIFFWGGVFKGVGILCAAAGPVGLQLWAQSSSGWNAELCACHETCDVTGNAFRDYYVAEPATCASSGAYYAKYNATEWAALRGADGLWNKELFVSATCLLEDEAQCNSLDGADFADCSCNPSLILPGVDRWCACYRACSSTCSIASLRFSMGATAVFYSVVFLLGIIWCVLMIAEGGNAHAPITRADSVAEDKVTAALQGAPQNDEKQVAGEARGENSSPSGGGIGDAPAKELPGEPAEEWPDVGKGMDGVAAEEEGEGGEGQQPGEGPVRPNDVAPPPPPPPAPMGPLPPPAQEEVGSPRQDRGVEDPGTSPQSPISPVPTQHVGHVGEVLANRAEEIPATPLIASMMTTFRNAPFVSILPAWVCDMTAITMIGTMLPFYVNYVVQPQNPEAVPQCVNDARCNPWDTSQSFDDFINGCPFDACCRSCTAPAVMYSPSLGEVTAKALDAGCYVCAGGTSEGNKCVGGTWTPDGAALVSTEQEIWCDNTVWMGLGLIMLIGAQVISMPFWLQAVETFGKRPTWLAFNLMNAVTNSLFVFVARGSPMTTTLLAFINGLPMGAQFLTDSILADVIDYDELLTGTRSEGRFTIFQTFIPKIVSIPAQAIPLSLVAALGFISPDKRGRIEEDQPERVVLFIQLVFFVIPFFLALTSFAIKYYFPLRPYHMQKILEGVALHKQGLSCVDPITKKCVVLPVLEEEDIANSNRLDHFWHWQLERYVALEENRLMENGSDTELPSGPVFLVDETTKAWRLCFVLFAGMLSLTIAGCLIGGTDPETGAPTSMLLDPSLQVIPVLGVIGAGIAGVATVAHGIRFDVAKSLVVDQIPLAFAQLWFKSVSGDNDAVATNDDKVLGVNTVLAETYSTYSEVQSKVKYRGIKRFQRAARKVSASARLLRAMSSSRWRWGGSTGTVAPAPGGGMGRFSIDAGEEEGAPQPEPEAGPQPTDSQSEVTGDNDDAHEKTE